MARSARRDDEDALDPVEEADLPTDEEQDDLDGFTDVDDEEEDLDDDLEQDDEAGLAFDDDEDAVDTELGDAEVDDEEGDELPSLLEDDEIAVVVAEADEDEDEEDALKDGEFICQSCFMAKRESALADPEAMLCRDCA